MLAILVIVLPRNCRSRSRIKLAAKQRSSLHIDSFLFPRHGYKDSTTNRHCVTFFFPFSYTDEMPISSVHGDFIYLEHGRRQREYTWDRENLVYRQRLRTRYVEDHWTPRHGILWRLVGVAIHGIGFIELTWQGQLVGNAISPIPSPLPSSD